MTRRSLSVLLALIIVFGTVHALPFSVSAQEADISEVGNPYTGGYANCTWTAWKCAYDDGYHLPDYSWGDAWQWYGNAQRDGYYCDKTPSAHSIIVYNATSINPRGHVAYVADYNSSTDKIFVKEGGYLGGYNEGWISAHDANLLGYIHLSRPIPVGHVMSEAEGAGRTIPDGDYWIGSKIVEDFLLIFREMILILGMKRTYKHGNGNPAYLRFMMFFTLPI